MPILIMESVSGPNRPSSLKKIPKEYMSITEVLLIVGRVLFALLFISSGVSHITKNAAMTSYAQYKKIPMAKIAVYISGVMLVLGGVYIALGFYADLGALLIFLFLVPTAFLMHPYWKETDAMTKMNEMIAFNKDIALAGAALAFFYIFAKHGETVGLVLSTTTLF